MELRDFDAERFLREYWQKKPLLIRSPWDAWSNPVEPDELAGLACEDHVESRLVTRIGDEWALEQGPLANDRFAREHRGPWTLLVQAVDHHMAEAADLLDAFRFVPNWRVDDVMVSYAVDGGGVGAHYDNYDVFLVQGMGRRRWELGGVCDEATALLPHADLRLLADFKAVEKWVLEPGDILYVPPRVAHRGVAVGDDCVTYSIGFRAPSRSELIENWSDSVLDELVEDDRYADPDLTSQDNPGEIRPEAIAGLHAMVAEKLLDQKAFAHWFGQYSTAPKNAEIDWTPEEPTGATEVRAGVAEGIALIRNPASRFAFVRDGNAAVSLFVDGDRFACTNDAAAFAERLCAESRFELREDPTPATVELIVTLIDRGSLAFDRED